MAAYNLCVIQRFCQILFWRKWIYTRGLSLEAIWSRKHMPQHWSEVSRLVTRLERLGVCRSRIFQRWTGPNTVRLAKEHPRRFEYSPDSDWPAHEVLELALHRVLNLLWSIQPSCGSGSKLWWLKLAWGQGSEAKCSKQKLSKKWLLSTT